MPLSSPKKGSGNTSLRSSEPDEEAGPVSPPCNVTTWKTTWIRLGPLLGLAALFLAFNGIFASFAILKASNGARVADWPLQPSVYLGVITAVANQALSFAALQGVAIAWWSGALKGTTIARLHRDWDTGTSIWSALIAGRHTGMLAVTCILSTLVAADGPLLQRASRVVAATIPNTPVTLHAMLSPEIPNGFSGTSNPASLLGTIGNGTYYDQSMSPEFANQIRDYSTSGQIASPVKGCPGICTATLQAPALALSSCQSSTVPYDYRRVFNASKPGITLANGQLNNSALSIPEDMVISNLFYEDQNYIGVSAFLVTFELWHDAGHEYVVLTVGRAQSNDTCATTYNSTTCNLRSAVAEYDVVIKSGNLSFATPANQARILSLANNTDNKLSPASRTVLSTLTGITEWLSLQYAITEYRVGDFSENQNCAIDDNVFSFQHESGDGSCVNYTDPFDTIMQGANELMFQTGIWAAQALNASQLHSRLDDSLSSNQTFQGAVQGTHNIFKTDSWFFVAAAVLQLACIVQTIPSYWGWWRLGREISFSPLEIAKAFEAPLLADCNSNSSGSSITETVGKQRVRYGAIGELVAEGRLPEYRVRKIAFADPVFVYQPLDRFRFET